MEEINSILRKKKKERLKINNIKDFKEALIKEGYDANGLSEENFKLRIKEIFNLENNLAERVHKCLNGNTITYRVKDIRNFIDYIEKIISFENEHSSLCEKLNEINELHIDREEYEREPSHKDEVKHIIKVVEEIREEISGIISKEEQRALDDLENELDREYIYAKDIELLKKMIVVKNEQVKEEYNFQNKIKRVSIKIPNEINKNYIPADEGSVEYYNHLSSNIPRIQRLKRNIHKYIQKHGEKEKVFKINQSDTLQDTINIAVAIYNDKKFKAISGKNDIENYCKVLSLEEAVFKSSKVNKLGELGIGYNRINDSEKKILEEVNKQIEGKKIKNKGELILYSKWEPCPSCYFVISQFCERYPNIKVRVKYIKKYGE